jgi:SAM-dependent methyltransferase
LSYDNPSYWRGLHDAMPDGLRAVGYPALSERFNELKYESEARTFTEVLDRHVEKSKSPFRVLDLGAGSGYWTRLVDRWAHSAGRTAELTAVDLSQPALTQISIALPHVQTVQGDLCTMNPGEFAGKFDLTYVCYCLHHLPRLDGHLNALRLACKSVAPGGTLIIMDPVLTLPYSPLDCHDFFSYNGNGVVRHLMTIEDVVQSEGLKRNEVLPAVSYILNGPVQASGSWRFALATRIWFALHRVYRSESMTRRLSGLLGMIDHSLKASGSSLSSSICVYSRPADSRT